MTDFTLRALDLPRSCVGFAFREALRAIDYRLVQHRALGRPNHAASHCGTCTELGLARSILDTWGDPAWGDDDLRVAIAISRGERP